MKTSELFEENGYALKIDVFTNEEIATMRNAVAAQFESDGLEGRTKQVAKTKAKYAKGDLLSKKFLRNMLMAKDILQSNEIVYFGDSTYQIGTGSRGFHRDSVDRIFDSGPDWQSPYNIIRIGIYLQDHKNYSGGLKIKVGSNNKADGKTIFINSNAGDVAAWSLKTLHSGNAVRLRMFPNYSINNSSIEKRVPEFLKRNEQQERMSLFMTFGVEGAHTDRYINEYMLKRVDVIESLAASKYNDEALALAASVGVQVIQPLQLSK